MEQKTFYQAIIDINIDPSRTKKCLSDKRLTQTEKKILESYLLIRDNQNQSALKLMRALSPSGLPFVEAQKQLLIGLCLNNLSHFTQAEEAIQLALPELCKLKSHYFLFMSYFNLALIYLNTSKLDKMNDAIASMGGLEHETQLQTIRFLRCQFAYACAVGDGTRANELLAELTPLKDQMPESDIISHLLCEFIFQVKRDELKRCEDILKEMKSYRKFHLTENYNFMKKLLDHLTKNTPIYASGNAFDTVPLLHHQLKVIQYLEEQNPGEAKVHWGHLQELSPEIYLPEFSFHGEKCLFSLCLDRHRPQRSVRVLESQADHSLLDKLIALLQNSQAPLTKGYIYESLWNETPEDKEDLKKLTRLAYKARTERGLEITSRKGTYYLEKSSGPNKERGSA